TERGPAYGAQTETQPFSLHSLPGKIWQGRHSPSSPWISAQLSQVWSGAGLGRVAASTVLASCVYFRDCATGSSSEICTSSCASASRGRMKQPAAATADNCMNCLLAILLKGVSLVCGRIATLPDG